MSMITRVFIVLFSLCIALIFALLWVAADCGLEPTMCKSFTLLSKLTKTWVIIIPFLIIALIPNRYNKTMMFVRFTSVFVVGFIFIMGLNNIKNMLLSEKYITLDIIMGPMLSLTAFSLICLLLLPEIKHLAKKSSGQSKNSIIE